MKKNAIMRSLATLGLAAMSFLASPSYAESAQNGPANVISAAKRESITPIIDVEKKRVDLEDLLKNKDENKDRQNYLKERELSFDLRSPYKSAEANSKLLGSANQLIGRASDYLGEIEGFDKNIFGRIGIVFADYYASHVSDTISHELGHARAAKDREPIISFEKFSGLFPTFATGYHGSTRTIHNLKELQDLAREEVDFAMGGLNQSQLNSYELAKNVKDKFSITDAIPFFTEKTSGVYYYLVMPSGSYMKTLNKLGAGPWSPNLKGAAAYKKWNSDMNKASQTSNDLDSMEYQMKLSGVDYSKKDYFKRALTADLLSARTFESIGVAANYLATGERIRNALAWEIGDSRVSLPLVNYFLTPERDIFNATSFVNSPSNSYEISAGIINDFIDKKKQFRFGGQYNGMKFSDRSDALTIHPFAYFTCDRDRNVKGYSAGASAELPISKDTRLTATAEYNNNE